MVSRNGAPAIPDSAWDTLAGRGWFESSGVSPILQVCPTRPMLLASRLAVPTRPLGRPGRREGALAPVSRRHPASLTGRGYLSDTPPHYPKFITTPLIPKSYSPPLYVTLRVGNPRRRWRGPRRVNTSPRGLGEAGERWGSVELGGRVLVRGWSHDAASAPLAMQLPHQTAMPTLGRFPLPWAVP